MELTQQLECSQEVYNTQAEKTCSDQIGFLGICGTKYPVVRGPNKIGRDPQKCSIVLNYTSISRQHAVLVVNKTDYLLMDLDAANKTRLSGKVLNPFIPNPISDGDTVQFGEVIGIFRLLEDDNELPMTQAIDIPDTPVATRCHTKTNKLATTIPESPDVSDRDDSFIVPSQPKFPKKFRSSITNNFIQSSAKTISIQPVGSNKIDNVYWSSSKRSLSVKMDDSNDSLNDSGPEKVEEKNEKTIYEMDTQVPAGNESTDSIYTAETQVPGEFNVSPSIHNLETQLPPPADKLPEVCKVDADQQDLHFDIFTANTEPDNSIFNAETQFDVPEPDSVNCNKNEEILNTSKEKDQKKSNSSDQEILLDDIDNESFLDEFESQSLLSEDVPVTTKSEDHVDSNEVKPDNLANTKQIKPLQRVVRIKSDSSTDCEDIGELTQKLPENVIDDDDKTDCEDEIEPDDNKLCPPASKYIFNKLEDMPTQIIGGDDPNNIPFEDMLTQVVVPEKSNEEDSEDLPTQVLPEYEPENPVYSEEIMSPFKVPMLTSVKKKKETDKTDSKINKNETPTKTSLNANDVDDDERYYAATQEIFDDLCSQRELTPERIIKSKGHHKIEQDSKENNIRSTKSSNSSFSDSENKSRLRNEKGVDKFVANMKKVPSDPSDSDLTPKKLRPFKFMTTDLPNSQEIKCHRSLTTCVTTESSSDTEVENDSEEHTPILFKKKKTKVNAKLNLTEKFDVENLPSRILTRIRKPTIKAESKYHTNTSNSILKPRYLTEQDDDIDNDIVIENITRLKNTAAKSKSKDVSKYGNVSVGLKEKQETKEDKKKETKGRSKDKSKNKRDESVKELKSTKSNSESKKKPVKTESVDPKIDSTTITNKSTRSSRSRKAKTEAKNDQKEPETKVKNDKKDADHPGKVDRRKRSNKVVAKIESSPEIEKDVRRSKRQKPVKKDATEIKPVSILKKTKHEQSTIYNISSESNTETPKTLKRPASDVIVESSSKRPRSNNSSYSSRSTNISMNSTASNISLRSSTSCRVRRQYVLFTAFPSDEVKSKLEKLGAIITSDVTACTVVLTMQIKRTFKLLCAVGLGKPIVGPDWVQACVDTNTIVDPWLYLMKDDAAEKRFKFSLRRTLTGKRDFLKGYKVSSTPAVMPNAQEMKLIVESSGGTWDEDLPNWVCVSTGADKSLWPTLRKRGAVIVSTEFILGGVLRQKLDVEGNKLK